MSSSDDRIEDAKNEFIEVKNELVEKKDEAKDELIEKKNEAKNEFTEKKNEFLQKLEDDGVVNPKGFAMAGAGALFIAAVPLTSFLAQPNGLLEKLVNAVCRGVAFVGSAGSDSNVSQNCKIAALSTLYITTTYAFSGATSAAAVFAGNKEGRDNNHPRAQVQNLQGLPLRLHSAHYHLLEKFPGFALAAALAQSMAPGDQTLINLLGLHVLIKLFVHWPAYVLNISPPRSVAHLIATSSVINVALKLSKQPSKLR